MSQVILVRLVPTSPRVATDFTTDLQGLVITAFDLTVQDSNVGVKLGSATFTSDEKTTSIYQYIDITWGVEPITLKRIPTSSTLESIATAVIVPNPPAGHLEYDTFDLRFEITRNGQSIMDTVIEYNVNLFPLQEHPYDYLRSEPSCYFQLPPAAVQLGTDVANVTLNPNGTPPSFDTLHDAINKVLSKDHPTPSDTKLPNDSLETLTTPLTPAQAGQIASEITWNRTLNPPPVSTITVQDNNGNPVTVDLWTMYTVPVKQQNGKEVPQPIASGSQPDLARQQFEANLSSYHSTLSSNATKLTNFVFAASAAVWCEQQTAKAPKAGLTFPIETNADENAPTYPESSIVLTNLPLDAYVVPAAYFYVLGAVLPSQISPAQRLTSAEVTSESQLVSTFQAARDADVLNATEAPVTVSGAAGINLAQAARRIAALGDITGNLPNVDYSTVTALVTGWLNYTGDTSTIDGTYAAINATYWSSAVTTNPTPYVTLLLEAITMGSPTVAEIETGLSITNVDELTAITPSQWTTYFTNHPDALPPFTAPGTPSQRISVFLARLMKFLTATPDGDTPVVTPVNPIVNFDAVPGDPILNFITAYNSSGLKFDFAQQPDMNVFKAAVESLFPTNEKSREWLTRAINTILALYQLTNNISATLQFSLMEALYARGITSVADVLSLSAQDFQNTLLGTVAYDYASQIQQNAGPAPQAPSTPDGTFKPVNDGNLVNCIPPANLSPFGKIAYLHDLLVIKVDDSTLGDVIAKRRGPIGDLQCTTANLETHVPQIDLINESLESLASGADQGAVHDTTESAEVVAAAPQYSSPAYPPAPIYEKLRTTFTTADLPYDQAEDISRSYLEGLGTSRFDVMRLFREDITELAIDASFEPKDFKKFLWRYPVRHELALEYIRISPEEYAQIFNGKTGTEITQLLGLSTQYNVSDFLKASGLHYHEFIELWKSKYVAFDSSLPDKQFPPEEPCAPQKIQIEIQQSDIPKLFVFVRLSRHQKVTFQQLADICNVIGLFVDDKTNSDFCRQLAAILIFTEHIGVPFVLAIWDKTKDYHAALDVLLTHMQKYAQIRYECRARKDFKEEFKSNIDKLADLAGFTTVDTWHAKPTSTLRFMEIFAKLYASTFTVAEVIFMFTADAFSKVFPISENLADPLSLPVDSPYDLWSLRRQLREVRVEDEWTWDRVQSTLIEFGAQEQDLKTLKDHFFDSQPFVADLPADQTNAVMWNAPRDGPFGYDSKTQQLCTTLPLHDEAVLHKLKNTRQLTNDEVKAVQELYFAPRRALAPFAAIFEDYRAAVDFMIQHKKEKRWWYFQRHVALFYVRCELIAHHLSTHVSAVRGRKIKTNVWKILHSLMADENQPIPDQWESDSGVPPTKFTYSTGNAFAAILGVLGTGLSEEFTAEKVSWRDVSGSMSVFGRAQDDSNSPIPTIIPSLTFTELSPQSFATISNGFLLNGQILGGAQPFGVVWSGSLLIEDGGEYTFYAGAPTPPEEEPDFEKAKHHRWNVKLLKNDETITLLSHPDATTVTRTVCLERGTYHIEIYFEQPTLCDDEEYWIHHLHTGFQVKYTGADTDHVLIAIPVNKLFVDTLETDSNLAPKFTSSLRDIRRTYQRAFKAVLFAEQLNEIDYFLQHASNFSGTSYYRTPDGFATHQAYFDFNFLPVSDPYDPPSDQRADPSLKRQAAMFDWWERFFDYTRLRRWRHDILSLFGKSDQEWLKCLDAKPFVLDYYPSYQIQPSDLNDERWPIRIAHAVIWSHELQRRFFTHTLGQANPSSWAADYPMLNDGDHNLMNFFNLSSFEAHSYKGVKIINDVLRERARHALIQYLGDVSDSLLQDIDACGESSRIEDALSAVEMYIQRSRLGLETYVDAPSHKQWHKMKRHQLYPEDQVIWEELQKAQKSEAFQFLQIQLRRDILTFPTAGGLVWWTNPSDIPSYFESLQFAELASLQYYQNEVQGMNLLGTPAFTARQSFLSAIPSTTSTTPTAKANIVSKETGNADKTNATNAIDEKVPVAHVGNADVPLWVKAAMEMGTNFIRVAAARTPAATRPDNAPIVDEYYFWLADSSYFSSEDVSESPTQGVVAAPSPVCKWDSPTAAMLQWTPRKCVYLYWTRIHFGRFDPPRRSLEGVYVQDGSQLTFGGRTVDSLEFSVSETQGSRTGFRYDMARDAAVTLPQLTDQHTTSNIPKSLTSYPYFIYFDAGAPLVPLSNFSPANSIANALRAHGHFEEALKWYESVYRPLQNNNAWRDLNSSSRAVLLEYISTLLDCDDKYIRQVARRLLGKRPRVIKAEGPPTTVSKFEVMGAPLNPRLLNLYDRLEERKYEHRSPYRFSSVLSVAVELAQLATTFGSELLSALEKGDSEYLENLRAKYDRQISTLTINSAKNQYRESDWETQALQQTLAGALERYNYYQNLINNGLNAGENGFVACAATDLATLGASTISEGIAEAMAIVPDIGIGGAGVFGSPLELTMIPIGSKLATAFQIASKILSISSQIAGTTGNLELQQSQWDRRNQEWNQEIDAITIELEQIECQKLASDRRKAIAINGLNNQLHQAERAEEIENVMRDKFTSQDLYVYLQQETAALYRQSYDLALKAAQQAQELFIYERRIPRNFLPTGWNSLREGLTAGDKLLWALKEMERVYMNENVREYEITKHISLRQMLPRAFLQLKLFGRCDIDLDEWMFDLDYPGQYMRRIKNVSITIPCVAGPYVSINCKLTLLNNIIRIDPSADPHHKHGQDGRLVCSYASTDSIATSSGQADAGLFSLNFNDDRYLPFEYAGAISRWRIDLPPENNQFSMQTLTDFVMHLSYTSREGGEALRQAANRSAQRHLPGGGLRLLDVRNELPSAWEGLRRGNLSVYLTRNMFPFILNRPISIVGVEFFIQVPHAQIGEHFKIKYKDEEIDCVDNFAEGLYRGVLHRKLSFSESLVFHLSDCNATDIYMLFTYEESHHSKHPRYHAHGL